MQRQRVAEEERKRKAEEERKRLEQEQARLEEERKRLEQEAERRRKERKEREEMERKRREAEQRRSDQELLRQLQQSLSEHIRSNFNITGLARGQTCKLRVRLAADGAVIGVAIASSSGDPVFDRRAATAVQKSSPLPVPRDAAAFERLGLQELTFVFDPWH